MSSEELTLRKMKLREDIYQLVTEFEKETGHIVEIRVSPQLHDAYEWGKGPVILRGSYDIEVWVKI